ncbi:MAG: P-loop NTPase [Eggerthellaceae bacterium]|nr:P-loop NTPase [Eggerthellaceae bacterium]
MNMQSIRGEIPSVLKELPSVVVVFGHYGVGKTNFSLNLAYDLAAEGRQVTLVDLDIVNPYFRSSDHAAALEAAGIRLLCPQSANTALDAPMLNVAIDSAIEEARSEEGHVCIIDAGGDDVGATALGRFSKLIKQGEHAVLYVVNALRELTKQPQEAADLLPEMEYTSHLRATHVVNNTHLMDATDESVVKRGIEFAEEVARILDVPLLCTAVPLACEAGSLSLLTPAAQQLKESIDSAKLTCANCYFVSIYVKKPWD